MNHDLFTGQYPVLEGETIRLRPPNASDVEPLYWLLQESLTAQDYWADTAAPSLGQVGVIYPRHALVNYQRGNSITWIIELKDTKEVVGIRDLFVDDEYKPVTVQGFVGAAYRQQGISREAYGLIIEFARSREVVGIRANTSATNFAAIALLYSVGFSPKSAKIIGDEELRLVFDHSLVEFKAPAFDSVEEKRLHIFCKMYLHGDDINITRNGYLRRDGQVWPAFRVDIEAENTISDEFSGITLPLSFDSDGVVIMSVKESDTVAFLDGRMPLTDTWAYCWNECMILN